jgi:C1A family cysteine protease
MKAHNHDFVGSEYRKRYAIFMANALIVKLHNRQSTFTLTLNKFAAFSNAEFRALHAALPTQSFQSRRPPVSRAPPDSVDWRQSSFVPPVVDAGSCSPWSFAAVVPFSFIHYNATGTNVTFSAQNLIDCVSTNQGCFSGNAVNAYRYLIDKQGGFVDPDQAYPLNSSAANSCKYNASAAFRVLSGDQSISTPGNEDELLSAVAAYGPVVTAVDASSPEFQLYGGGVFYSASCSKILLSQPLVIVGYGAGSDGAYWIAQNSWGTGWGEKGYIRVLRGSNICGIATEPVYPILK